MVRTGPGVVIRARARRASSGRRGFPRGSSPRSGGAGRTSSPNTSALQRSKQHLNQRGSAWASVP
eukprot:1626791-Alexandrium_andersonii.AAC.1